MMKLPINDTHGSWKRATLFACLLLVATGAPAIAGDNDPVGDLPTASSGGAGGGSNQDQVGGPGGPSEGQPWVRSEPGAADEPLAGAERTRSATLVASQAHAATAATADGSGQAFSAQLDPALDAVLLLPDDVVAAQAYLLLDSHAEASLAQVLDGQVALDAAALVPMAPALDVDHLASLVAHSLPAGSQVTWVAFSLDSLGQLHVSAVRVSADGQASEVLID